MSTPHFADVIVCAACGHVVDGADAIVIEGESYHEGCLPVTPKPSDFRPVTDEEIGRYVNTTRGCVRLTDTEMAAALREHRPELYEEVRALLARDQTF